MNKNNLHNVDSLLESGSNSTTKSNPSKSFLLPKKHIAILVVAGALAVVAALAASVAVVIAIRTSQELHGAGQQESVSTTGRGDPLIDLETKEQLLKQVGIIVGLNLYGCLKKIAIKAKYLSTLHNN